MHPNSLFPCLHWQVYGKHHTWPCISGHFVCIAQRCTREDTKSGQMITGRSLSPGLGSVLFSAAHRAFQIKGNLLQYYKYWPGAWAYSSTSKVVREVIRHKKAHSLSMKQLMDFTKGYCGHKTADTNFPLIISSQSKF